MRRCDVWYDGRLVAAADSSDLRALEAEVVLEALREAAARSLMACALQLPGSWSSAHSLGHTGYG